MADRQKSPRELRKITLNFQNKISAGATVSSYLVFASRRPTLTETLAITTLTAQLNPEDATATLDDDPVIGSLIMVDPDDIDLEETFKVTSSTPSGGNFICGIMPTAERMHASTATVHYEPGESARMLVDDTPTPTGTNGVLAVVHLKEGADGYTYRVNAQAICNNGEVREDETEIDVVEFTPTSTIHKQPADTVDVAIDFADWTTKYSTTVLSAVSFVSRARTMSTTVNGTNNAGATTLNLNAHPGVGALLTVNVGQATQEKLIVSGVSGSGPYVCTVSPLQFQHTNAQAVDYFPGMNTRVLVSTTPSTSSVTIRLQKAAAGQSYRMVPLATLADGQVAQKSIELNVSET